jgi:hypothetical protein
MEADPFLKLGLFGTVDYSKARDTTTLNII